MFYLAAHPEWQKPLREEAEAVTKAEGWTKDSVNKMVKVDSFLRESQRSKTIARCELIQPPDCLL